VCHDAASWPFSGAHSSVMVSGRLRPRTYQDEDLAMPGDWLLFGNTVVLDIMFVPTLLKRGANVQLGTAGVYVAMIAIGALGYSVNGQWLPVVPAACGSFLWLLMFLKSWKGV
jgi:CHASE2 domain-containing sensor protein